MRVKLLLEKKAIENFWDGALGLGWIGIRGIGKLRSLEVGMLG
jgi:hypothetical protein